MKRFLMVGAAVVLMGNMAFAQNYPNQPKPVSLIGATALEPLPPAAGMTPFMLSLVTPIQVPAADWDVKGLRISLLYGECREMLGLDIGVVSQAFEARALQISVINMAETMKGLQIGVINYAGTAVGLQIGVVNIIADKDWAFLPIVNASF